MLFDESDHLNINNAFSTFSYSNSIDICVDQKSVGVPAGIGVQASVVILSMAHPLPKNYIFTTKEIDIFVVV